MNSTWVTILILASLSTPGEEEAAGAGQQRVPPRLLQKYPLRPRAASVPPVKVLVF
jgi:hypothetical protein